MKKILSIALSLLLVALMLPAGIFSASADAFTLNTAIYNGDVKVDVPTSWWSNGVSYPRIIQLHNGNAADNNALLATFSEHSRGVQEEDGTTYEIGYPIYRSNDLGQNWELIARVKDPVNDSTQRAEWMPSFYELPEDFGDMKKGTLLLAAVSHDDEQKTYSAIQLYQSSNGGYDWDFVTTIATGGGVGDENTPNTGVWEPELELINGELICYYADNTDSDHSQRIVYRTSEDGSRWSAVSEVVALADATHRPGMPVVTKTANGYFMVYEMVGSQNGVIYYKTSTDGLNWGSITDMGTKIATADGNTLSAAPYCAWTPYGGDNGTIFVNAANMDGLDETVYFVSQDNGATWTTVTQPIQVDDDVAAAGYSSGMTFSADGKILFAINNPTETETETESGSIKTTTCVKSATVELETGAAALAENQYGTTSVADLVEDASGYNASNVSWSEDFTSTTTAPMTMHTALSTVNEVVDGSWHIGTDVENDKRTNGSLTGLLGGRKVGDFAISYELTVSSQWGTRDYIFHGTTGWGNGSTYNNYDSFIRFAGSEAAIHSVTLVNGGNLVASDIKLSRGKTYNVVLVSVGTVAELYIWEKGTNAPSVPTATAVSETEKTGDFHLNTFDANDYVDNIKIYEPDAVLSHKEISAVVGREVNEENLKYENYFNGAEDALTMDSAAVNTVSAGKWNISTASGSSAKVTTGLTGNSSLGDFVMAFEYKKTTEAGARNFMFHTASAHNALEASDTMLQIRWNGAVKLYSEGNNGVTQITDANCIARNVTYNIVIKSVGRTIDAYIWAKGTDAPTQPTLSVTAANDIVGDVYFDFYDTVGETADAIRIYELGVDNDVLSDVTGTELKDELVAYENRFDSADDIAKVTYDKSLQTNSVIDGQWNLLAQKGSSGYLKNLAGKDFRNFVVSLELTVGQSVGTRQIFYHGMNEVREQRSSVYIDWQGIVSMRNNGTSGTGSYTIKAGVTYNFVLVSIDNTASVYVWPKGSPAPTAPAVTSTNQNTLTGDISLSFYHDGNTVADKIDNIVIYDLPVTTDDIAAVSGEELTDDMLVVENYINNTAKTPAKRFTDQTGVSEVRNNQWYLDKENATSTGLVGYDLTDFVAAFEYKTGSEWGNRRFSFHTDTGWADQQESYLRFDYKSGDSTNYLVPTLYHGDAVATTDAVLNVGKYYNIVIKSVGYTASVYMWEMGTAAPSEPILTATSSTAAYGDLYLYTYESANDYIDNIRVYNIGEEMTFISSMPMDIRTEFVSGIIAEFGYAPMEGMEVIEQGITVNCGDEVKTVKTDSTLNYMSAVITGDLTGKTVTAQAYLTFKTAAGVQYTIYGSPEKASVTLLGLYVNATYGDATGDGKVNILDLIRMKKAIAGTAETIVSANVEYDGVAGLEGSDLAMQKKVLLLGADNLVPTDVDYIKF